jgi:hypothetical protein
MKKALVCQDAEEQQVEDIPPPPYQLTLHEPMADLTNKELKSIFVRDIDTGRSQNVGPLRLGASIKDLRAEVSKKQGWPVQYVRMLFGAKELEDGMKSTFGHLAEQHGIAS